MNSTVNSTVTFALSPTDGWYPFAAANACSNGELMFNGVVYASFLYQASQLISDGSEMLMLVPEYAAVVGSVVLPILGAVPDGMMVLFSGLGPDAQNQVSVGVGALAGSTVMLLTLPWFVAVFCGRVSINEKGQTMYKMPPDADPKKWDKLNPPGTMNLFKTGISYGPEIQENGKVMLMTLIGYFIIQIPATMWDVLPKPGDLLKTDPVKLKGMQDKEAGKENIWALVGLVVCLVEFMYYLVTQWNDAHRGEGGVSKKITDTTVEAMKNGQLTLRAAMAKFRHKKWTKLSKQQDLNHALLDTETMDEVRDMCKVLAPFFAHYDTNGDKQIEFDEFQMILRDLNETLEKESQKKLFNNADIDSSGAISFEEFAACLMTFALDGSNDEGRQGPKFVACPSAYVSLNPKNDVEQGDDDEDEGEEKEDVPEDLADLAPEEQQRRIKFRAFTKMFAGTVLCLIFSDPMVDLLSEFGTRIGVRPFYISFIFAPLASNASEFVSAYTYAKKRTIKSMTTSLSTLEGAAIMNNTFCLGIFLALVYCKNLAWEFTAETVSIIAIQLMLGFSVIFRRQQKLMDGLIVLSYYPMAMGIVAVLEALGWD